MNKQLSLLTAGLLAMCSSQAQQSTQVTGGEIRHHNPKAEAAYQHTLSLLAGNGAAQGLKTSGSAERVAAAMIYYDPGTGLQPSDSMRYLYSSNRGSVFSHDALGYHTVYGVRGTGNGFIDCDTSVVIDPQSGNVVWGNENMRSTGSGRIGSQGPFGSFGGFTNVFYYDLTGRMTEDRVRNFDPNTNSWQDIRRNRYTYNAQGRLATDSTQTWTNGAWRTGYVTINTYNAGGLPTVSETLAWDGSILALDSRTKNTYDGNGRLQTILYEYHDGSNYVPDTRDSFSYSGDRRIYAQSILLIGTQQFITFRNFRHLNAAGLVDSSMSINYDIVTNDQEKAHLLISYNAAGNPVRIRSYKDGKMLSRTDYYYESHQTTGVAPLAQQRKAIAVFPNPAVSAIQLRPAISGGAALSLVNAAGQTVSAARVQLQAGQVFSLPVGDLLPGHYWLQLQDETGQQYSAAFIKQ